MNIVSNPWKSSMRLFPILGSLALSAAAAPLQVCCTTPELGDLIRQVAGDEAAVTVFAKSVEDPHFVEAKPGFIKALHRADLYVQNGLDLEVGWAPVLLRQAANARVQTGAPGFCDACRFITAIDVPTGEIDRSMGDVHPAGNPHYLLDPHNGLKVADGLRVKLSELRPEKAAHFQQRYAAFAERLNREAEAAEKAMEPFKGRKVMADHNMWPYFARCYGLVVAGFLEPKPGIPPTTKHLAGVVDRMKSEHISVVMASAYYDPRHAEFVRKGTGCAIAELAHQVGARPGTDDYVALCAYNVKQLAQALAAGK